MKQDDTDKISVDANSQKGGVTMGGPAGAGGGFWGGNIAFILFLVLILLFFGDP